MGVKMYWIVVAVVILLGMILPQQGPKKKYYIILMALLHSFICGFRYMYITGDLIKYANSYYYYNAHPELSWFSDSVFNGGRNAGFQWLEKAISLASGGDYQVFLIFLAVFAEITLAILIYRYSPRPWLSYLVWNCFSFYVTYDFCAIKQGFAMAILVISMVFILENKPWHFLITTLIAGFIHMPALAFLPAYWLMKRMVNMRMILVYSLVAFLIFVFRNQLVIIMQDIYYAGNDEIDFIASSDTVGGRFFVIALIAFSGAILMGFREQDFAGLFSIMITAAILQMFSVYDNVFTRFADYYLQFSVLYIPMIFYEADYETPINSGVRGAILPFNDRSIRILVSVLTVILIWWYYRTALGTTITYETDNYLNYRFMWEVTN